MKKTLITLLLAVFLSGFYMTAEASETVLENRAEASSVFAGSLNAMTIQRHRRWRRWRWRARRHERRERRRDRRHDRRERRRDRRHDRM